MARAGARIRTYRWGPQVDEQGQTIGRAVSGDAAACREIYNAHSRRVKAYFLRSGFVPADADDLLQETFIRAFRSLATYDPARGALGAWLAAIARNAARRRWAVRPAPENYDPELAERVLVSGDNPGRSAEMREEVDAVRHCIGTLTADLQCAVRLRYIEGRTTRGIAAEMNLPEATVRLRLEEARRRIEACLRSKGVVQ